MQQTGSAQLQFSQIISGGNPGTYQQVTFSVGAELGGTSSSATTARYRDAFRWDPAVDGPLGTMSFSMDARNFSSRGFSSPTGVFWRPLLVQDRVAYTVSSSGLTPALPGGFETLNWTFSSASDWVSFQGITLKPNFSASGSIIRFGYRSALSSSCSSGLGSCVAASTLDGLDNYRVELTAQQAGGEVPEPSTWVLVASSVLLAAKYRNRGGTRRDGAAA